MIAKEEPEKNRHGRKMQTRKLSARDIIFLPIALGPVQLLRAQDDCGNECKLNTNLGVIVSVPVNPSAQVVATGWGQKYQFVTAISAKPPKSGHAGVMLREIEEVEYVLAVLLRMRDEASATPELYDPDAWKRIDEAITRFENVRREAQMMTHSVEQNLKAA